MHVAADTAPAFAFTAPTSMRLILPLPLTSPIRERTSQSVSPVSNCYVAPVALNLPARSNLYLFMSGNPELNSIARVNPPFNRLTEVGV